MTPALSKLFDNNESMRNMGRFDRAFSLAGGTFLLLTSFRTHSRLRTLLGMAGAEMLRRGFTGRCYAYDALGIRTQSSNGDSPAIPHRKGVHAKHSITINLPRDRVYGFWSDLRNLPRVMKHLVTVEPKGANRSRWVAAGPAGSQVEWDAETINEVPGELIAWRSLPDSEVSTAGSVTFKDAPGGRGTEVHVQLQYLPPAGPAGALVAKLFGRDAQTEIEEDLDRLKQYLETGEVASVFGQPFGPGQTPKAGGE
jgi:uncharacterized membrane protein